jgi:hypothetical protein
VASGRQMPKSTVRDTSAPFKTETIEFRATKRQRRQRIVTHLITGAHVESMKGSEIKYNATKIIVAEIIPPWKERYRGHGENALANPFPTPTHCRNVHEQRLVTTIT